jgi:hypothetical protein
MHIITVFGNKSVALAIFRSLHALGFAELIWICVTVVRLNADGVDSWVLGWRSAGIFGGLFGGINFAGVGGGFTHQLPAVLPRCALSQPFCIVS